jgi:hypothetical protein
MSMTLFSAELRRALHRRLVWVLIGLALAGILVTGVLVFVATGGPRAAVGADSIDPARMTDWWRPDIPDGVVLLPGIMLFLGALIGGASVVGAEWRSGGVTTMLTWAPRRNALLLARLGAAGLLAGLISLALQLLYLAALVPSVTAHGTAAGADGTYLAGLLAVLLRISVVSAVAAVLGGAIANIGRATVAALGVVWGWLLIGESLVRVVRPGLARWLLSENVGRVVVYQADRNMSFARPGWLALVTLLAYTTVAVVGAVALFSRRDVLTA